MNKQMQLLPIFALVAALLFAVAPFVGAQAAGLPVLQQDATPEPTEVTVEGTADATPEATAEATTEAAPAADAGAAVSATSEQTITVEDLSNMT